MYWSYEKPNISRVGISQTFDIFVKTEDTSHVPTFYVVNHLINSGTLSPPYSAISILSPKYVGGKKLSKEHIEEIYNFMCSELSNSRYLETFYNHWELMCFLWDMNNTDKMIPDDAEMPDYRLLK